jgi:hypothetical protein
MSDILFNDSFIQSVTSNVSAKEEVALSHQSTHRALYSDDRYSGFFFISVILSFHSGVATLSDTYSGLETSSRFLIVQSFQT